MIYHREMNLVPYLGWPVAALIALWVYLRMTGRNSAMAALARRMGLTYLGTTLPAGLSLRETELAQPFTAWNVMDGLRNGVRLVVFDIQIGLGRGSWSTTAIAIQGAHQRYADTMFNPELKVEQSEGWTILYHPRGVTTSVLGLTPIPELEAQLNAIGA